MACWLFAYVNVWRNTLAVSLVFFAVGCGSKPDQPPPSVQSIVSAIDGLKQEVNQNTAVLHRALGKQIPTELPAEVEEEIKSLEDAFAAESSWPTSKDDAKKLCDRVEQVLRQLPPWAEEDLLPRLNAVRWNAEVVLAVRANENTPPDNLEAAESKFSSLLDATPTNSSPRLREYLNERLEQTSKALRQYRREHAVKAAQDAIQGHGDTQVAWSNLEAISADKQIESLRRDLRRIIAEKVGRERLAVIRLTLDKTKSLKDDKHLQAALAHVYDGAVALLLDLMAEEPCPDAVVAEVRSVMDDCTKQLTEVGLRQRTDFEKRAREYQAWALRQIREFNDTDGWQYEVVLKRVNAQLKTFEKAREPFEWSLLQLFPSTQDLLKEKLNVDLSDVKGALLTPEKQQEIYKAAYGRISWKNDIDQELAYRTTRDGIVKYLLPINVALLDPPVAQIYQKAFNKAWEKLDSRPDDQLYVAEQAAVIKKQGIE